MYVVEVMPFVRGSNIETLTYYASEEYEPGMLVAIPIRSKIAHGIVTDCKPVSAAKAAVRAATFSLRRLPDQSGAPALPPLLRKTAERLTATTPTTVGSALFALLPPEVRDGLRALHADSYERPDDALPLISVLQGTTEERYRVYRSRIREAFAHRGSVLFVVPATADVERAYEELSRGIADRVVVFAPNFGAARIRKAYDALEDTSHAKLIIVTPRHAFLYRHDLTTIIIEGSRSPYYKSRMRPYFDMRDVLMTLAREGGQSVLLGDLLPRSEDEYERRMERYQTESEHPKRMLLQSKLRIIEQRDKPTADAPFALLSSPLVTALEHTTEARKNMFLLAARRGLAPVVACADCGHIFRCPDSGRPFSLLRTGSGESEERWFISGTSGKRVRAADVCTQCGSWRLRERGIGIQHIEEVVRELFPAVPTFVFDHTTATTYKKAQRIMQDFYDTKGAILIGTPMVLPHLALPVEHSAVVSLDATRSVPSWRADEDLFALLLLLRERTAHTVFVQTRTEPDTLLEHAAKGLVEQFYTDELALREQLAYPPFTVFIHVTLTGTPEAIAEQESEIAAFIDPYRVSFYTTAGDERGQTVRNGLIRIDRRAWPDPALMDKLRALPPSVRIEIDPPRIV